MEHIAIIQSNEDARIHASDMSEMSHVIQLKPSKIWMSLTFSVDLLVLQSHNKVAAGRFSVLYIDGCPLGTVYFAHHSIRLSLAFQRHSSGF